MSKSSRKTHQLSTKTPPKTQPERAKEHKKGLSACDFLVTYNPMNFVAITRKFMFGDCLGKGSFAKVYSAYDKETHRSIAVKVLDKVKL
jgi:serine/threonine protein kinase